MDDIIAMAREAGAGIGTSGRWLMTQSVLERFDALVRADERNKLATWMIAKGYATGHGDTTDDLLKELEWQVRESEREECAKVCDEASDKALSLQSGRQDDLGSIILRHHAVAHQADAAAIRARSQA